MFFGIERAFSVKLFRYNPPSPPSVVPTDTMRDFLLGFGYRYSVFLNLEMTY